MTTWHCTEGVRWLAMQESIRMYPEQISALGKAIGFGNYRPSQALTGRLNFDWTGFGPPRRGCIKDL